MQEPVVYRLSSRTRPDLLVAQVVKIMEVLAAVAERVELAVRVETAL